MTDPLPPWRPAYVPMPGRSPSLSPPPDQVQEREPLRPEELRPRPDPGANRDTR